MKRIFVINGEKESGKDTFVFLCKNILSDYHLDPDEVVNVSMVDKIKDIATEIGWDGKKNAKDRKFLADLKDLCDDYNNFSMRQIDDAVENFMASDIGSILFIHAREPQDIALICETYDADAILIRRKNMVHSKVELAVLTSNHADRNVYKYDYDVEIENPGILGEYKDVALEFLQTLGIFD